MATLNARPRKNTQQPKVGDYVLAVGYATSNANRSVLGLCGTVVGYSPGGTKCAIEFDESFNGGHNCSGMTKNGYGQWMYHVDLEILDKVPEIDLDVTSLL